MNRFTKAIWKSLETENWFGALFIALALPDICGGLETPEKAPGERYKDWFDRYLAQEYLPIFTAQDCYSLRCACLHQGLTTNEKSAVKRIHFVEQNWRGHLNKSEAGLVMDIHTFCADMCLAVDRWSEDVKDNAEIQERRYELVDILWDDDDLDYRAIYQ
jgi:hypothetical protein